MKKILFVLILLALVWSFNFGQDFTTPVNISRSPDNIRWVQVAMGPLGEAYVCWEEDYQGQAGSDIVVKTYDGIKWSDPIKLKNSPSIPSQRPSIYCSTKGVVAVIWAEGEPSQIKVREYDPKQRKWLPAFQVSNDAVRGVVEQTVAVDPEGNIYTTWAGKGEGRLFTRSKINGQLESIKRLDSGAIAEHPVMAAGKDGWVWAVFRQRVPPERKMFYAKRKHDTNWTSPKYVWEGGSSQGHPGITVGPDNIPYIAYGAESGGDNVDIYLVKFLEGHATREEIFPSNLQHDPRVAVDAFGNRHVAIQIGGGDYGTGIEYRNNMGGKWNESRVFPNSCCGAKLPGISADPFGNVAVVWSANGQAWFTSLQPVQIKKLEPPINLSANLSFAPDPTYRLNWAVNPENTTSFVGGYNIYKKESSDSDFVKILSVSKTTLTSSFTYSDVKPGIQYGITTLSISGTESDMVLFQIVNPTIYPPANTNVKVILKSVKQAMELTYALSWEGNPQNSAKYVKSYKIYKKEGTGDFVLSQILSNATFSLTQTNTNPQVRITYAITTLSALDTESAQVVFGIQ